MAIVPIRFLSKISHTLVAVCYKHYRCWWKVVVLCEYFCNLGPIRWEPSGPEIRLQAQTKLMQADIKENGNTGLF